MKQEAPGTSPPLPFPSLPFPLLVLLVGFKLSTRPRPPLGSPRGPSLVRSPPGAEPPGLPAAASALLSSALASQKATNLLPQLQRGGLHASISPPSQPGPSPACLPPCAPSSAGPIPPNVLSRPLPSAPPGGVIIFIILFFFGAGVAPEELPGWNPAASLPSLPALRPPGRRKPNLGSGLEGGGRGNLLPATSTGEK